MSSNRTVGSRRQRPYGMLRPPTPEEREWVKAMARRRTRVPKGVFRYRCIEEANADWERWHVDMVADAVSVSAKARTEGPSEGGAHAYTRPATWEDVLQVARLLNRHRVRYMLVGGYALAAHGYVRMTEDIDIAVAPEVENSRRWVAALAELPDRAAAELSGEADPFQGDHLHAIRINDEFTVDILPSVAGVPFAELEGHAVVLEFEGERIPVLNLDGLLLTKQGVRAKDQADAELLRRAVERRQKGES